MVAAEEHVELVIGFELCADLEPHLFVRLPNDCFQIPAVECADQVDLIPSVGRNLHDASALRDVRLVPAIISRFSTARVVARGRNGWAT